MKILIADDQSLWLGGVRQALALDDGFEIVGETSHGPEVLPLVNRLSPQVVLVGMQMVGIHGLMLVDQIRSRHPEVKIVVSSEVTDLEQVQTAFNHGVCGYIVKSIDERDLVSAIRQATEGTAFHALGLSSTDDSAIARAAGLSEREIDVVRAVGAGLTNKEIGQRLWITPQTVKFHLTNIFRKLGVTNRTEAARWAHHRGLGGDVMDVERAA